MKRFILVGADPSKGSAEHPGGQITACDGLIRYARQEGLTVDVIDTNQSSFPVPALKTRIFKGLARLKELNTLLSKYSYQGVIIFSSAGFSFYERCLMAGLCRLRSVQSLLFIRSGHFIQEVKASKTRNFLTRIMLKFPSRIGAQGRPWVDFYRTLGISEKRICIVRNWISFDFPIAAHAKRVDADASVSFVFVGWLVEAKGILQLLTAVEKLKGKYNFTVSLIGGGTLKETARKRAETDLVDHITVFGWQDKKQVQEHLEAADIFILPSSAEGFPNALLEAMALGLPAISTDVGAISDSLFDNVNGFLLPDNNPERIAEAMEEYLKNPDLVALHSQETLKIFNRQHGWKANCSHLFSQFSE